MNVDDINITHYELAVSVSCVCSGLCTACLAALLAAWWLAPRWRTLHNCVSLNQVAAGTLWQYCQCVCVYYYFSFIRYFQERREPELLNILQYYKYVNFISQMLPPLRIIMSCWSLFAIAYAYIKLVLLHRHRISCEKITAIVMTYGLAGMIQTIVYVVEEVFKMYAPVIEHVIVYPHCIPIAMAALVWVLFIRICISVTCCRPAVSSRNRTHVMALVGVAVMCDTFDIVHAVVFFYVENYFWIYRTSLEYIMCLRIISIALRVITHTVFVLFKKTSRIQFKLYFASMRNRVSNDIELS